MKKTDLLVIFNLPSLCTTVIMAVGWVDELNLKKQITNPTKKCLNQTKVIEIEKRVALRSVRDNKSI